MNNKITELKPILCFCAVVMVLLATISPVAADLFSSGLESVAVVGGEPSSIIEVGSDGTSMLLIGPSTASSMSGCSYYLPITISNTGTTALANIRARMGIPADSLIGSGLLQNDADDSAFKLGSTLIDHTAANLSYTGSGTWTAVVASIPVSSSTEYRMHVGDASATPRDQIWHANSGDNNYAADDTALDITTGLELNCNLYLAGTPSGEKEIISKEGNYELVVDGTPAAKLKVWKRGTVSTTVNGTPNAAGYTTNLGLVGAPTNWQAVIENDDDTSYVSVNGALTWDYYNITGSVPEGLTVNSVTVYGIAKATPPAFPGTIAFALRLGATNSTSANQTLTVAYATYSATIARPGGGSWVKSDIVDLQIGLGLAGAAFIPRCTKVYASINCNGLDGPYTVTVPLSVGTPYTLSGSFTGTLLGISDGSTTSSLALSGTLNANQEPVHIAEFNGKIDDLAVVKSGSTVMSLDFEADEISGTAISDQSVEGNDVTYSLTTQSSGITVVTGPLTACAGYVSTSSETTVVSSGVVGDISQPKNFYGGSEGEDLPMFPLIEQASVDMGWSSGSLYVFLMVISAIAFGVGVVIATGSTLMGVVACLVLMFAAVSTGVLPLWILLVSALLMVGYLVSARAM